MKAIKPPYTVTIEITEDADGWHLPTSEEYERRRMAREFIVKEYQTFPYHGAVHEMPELIRCRKCKWHIKGGFCDLYFADRAADEYCSRAERKEE